MAENTQIDDKIPLSDQNNSLQSDTDRLKELFLFRKNLNVKKYLTQIFFPIFENKKSQRLSLKIIQI